MASSLELRAVVLGALSTALVACHAPAPASPQPPAPDAIHRFAGDIRVGGNDMDFLAILVRDPADPAGYVGTIDIPKQALHGASLVNVAFRPGKSVAFELAREDHARWVGVFGAGDVIDCRFSQGEHSHSCTLREVVGEPIERLKRSPTREESRLVNGQNPPP